MGCSFSCNILSSTSNSSKGLKSIRIVHLNGHIEYVDHSVTVAQVTGNPPGHLLFTYAQLQTNGSPLKLDVVLEPGRVYFLLPFSLFNYNISPTDLAPLAKKLANMAQNSRSKSKSGNQNMSSALGCNSPVWHSSVASPNRLLSGQSSIGAKIENNQVVVGTQKPSKSRLWKPILATIREISFNRRSVSDMQENVKVESAK